ncbi:hypothetical protein PTKU46_81350 [Paraburkholderia terrae]
MRNDAGLRCRHWVRLVPVHSVASGSIVMRETIKIGAGAAAIVAIYLLTCTGFDHRAAEFQRCSVVRCT